MLLVGGTASERWQSVASLGNRAAPSGSMNSAKSMRRCGSRWRNRLGAEPDGWSRRGHDSGGLEGTAQRKQIRLSPGGPDELERRGGQFGLVTMCAAGGMAPAIIIERIAA